jgi:hypothetical protein
VQRDASNSKTEAKFTANNGPFAKVAWIHSWAYTVSEDGTTVSFGHRPDDSTRFPGNPETDDDEFVQFTKRAIARVVVRGAVQPRAAAAVYRPGRRQVRLLP